MDELKKLLEKLELSEDVVKELSEAIQTIVETKVQAQTEKAKEVIQEETEEKNSGWREEEIQKLEEKYEEYKDTMTAKFSEFVDQVLKEDLVIPDQVKQFARIGQIYEPIIETIKTKIAVDQGLIDEEVKGILSEAKDKIVELQEKYDDVYGQNLEFSMENEKLKIHTYLHEKCEDLTLDQKAFVFKVLSDADSIDEVDKKFDIVLEQAGKDPLGPDKMEGQKKEGSKGPGGDDDAAKKKKEMEKAKGYKEHVKKKDVSGSEDDSETMGSQGDKKISPEKQNEDVDGKGIVTEEDDDDDKKAKNPLMEDYVRLAFTRSF